ncbi:MAG TPA: hypothetical protein PKK10_17165 [Woeseiaceae bacterium]|nr:hypothetical protein [Woeseiaceae bacterium]
MSLLNELKRRNVIRVATGYALSAWIFIEAGSVLLPTFGASNDFFKAYVMVVIAGFVVAVLFAWIFEITPEGIKRESRIDRGSYRQRTSGNKNLPLIILLIVALLVSIGFNLGGLHQRQAVVQTGSVPNAVAVLPFENRSADPENAYFADGLHDDLLDRLAANNALRVISSISVNAYRDSDKSLGDIGAELGVNAVVEGAVQRVGDKVRVSVQLYDTATGAVAWSNSYDADASMQDVFELQSDISRNITDELNASLSPDAAARLAVIPTRNAEAYELYVKAANNLGLHEYDSLLLARQQFEQAVAIDPDYALAQAGLAETVMGLVTLHNALPAAEAYEIADRAVALALKSDPRLAYAYAVRGMIATRRWSHTHGSKGNIAAAADFERALALNSNLSNAYVWYSELRQDEDQIDQAIDLLLRGLSVDPRNRLPYVQLPILHALKGDNQRAIELCLEAMQVFPDWPAPYELLARHLQKLGRLDEAVAWAVRLRELSTDPIAGARSFATLRAFGREDLITQFLAHTPTGHPLYPVGQGLQQYLAGQFAASLATLSSIPDTVIDKTSIVYPLMARAALRLQDYEAARRHLYAARPELAGNATDVMARIDRHNADAALLLAYVAVAEGEPGRSAQLLAATMRISETMPAVGLGGYGIRNVQILELQGYRDRALAALQAAIDEGFVSEFAFDYWEIDENPILANLRNDPRYTPMQQQIQQRLEHMRQKLDAAVSSGDWQLLRDQTIAGVAN